MARKKNHPGSTEGQDQGKPPSEQFSIEKRLPPNELHPIAESSSSTILKTDMLAVEKAKLNEIVHLLWLPEGLSKKDQDARLIKAIDLFESIKPTDGIEAMLAAQMVGTHEATMECLRRAMIPGQIFEVRNASLGHAQKLMALYTRQLAALDKHRGKGQQKVTVEHVHVASGGQAIVGHVEAGPGGKTQETPGALEAPGEKLPSSLGQRERKRARKR